MSEGNLFYVVFGFDERSYDATLRAGDAEIAACKATSRAPARVRPQPLTVWKIDGDGFRTAVLHRDEHGNFFRIHGHQAA